MKLFNTFKNKLLNCRSISIKFCRLTSTENVVHPYSCFTLVLSGSYLEYIPVFNSLGKKFAEFYAWRGPGDFSFKKAKHPYTIKTEGEKSVYVFRITGPLVD